MDLISIQILFVYFLTLSSLLHLLIFNSFLYFYYYGFDDHYIATLVAIQPMYLQALNECTGVQNPHRDMHAYSIIWLTVYDTMHVQCQEY